jgi:superfamily II DNA/RNA helicase
VPSRRLAERVAHDLEQRLGEGVVAAHHGALSKRTRQSVEARLQTGALKAVVATASLELGIDVGEVELVIQIGSPRAIAVLRQRIGRACHNVGGTPKGRLIAMTRDDLIECAAAVRAMQAGRIDRPVQRDCPLDILAQQLVATCAAEDHGHRGPVGLARRAAPFSGAGAPRLRSIPHHARRRHTTRRGRSGALLHLDRIGTAPAAVAAPSSRPSPPAARSRTRPITPSIEDAASRSSAPSTRTSRSTAWSATSSSSARTRGGSAGSSRAACASRTRTARRPTSRSGTARAWPAAPSSPPR